MRDVRLHLFEQGVPVVGTDHVHVRHGDGEAVFEVEEGIDLRESQNMKMGDLSKAQQLAAENRQLIVEKWHEHIG